jgi:hypothetical protein
VYCVIALSFTFLIKFFFSSSRFSVEVYLISDKWYQELSYDLTCVSYLDLPILNLRAKP